jgi:O-antigen ligase
MRGDAFMKAALLFAGWMTLRSLMVNAGGVVATVLAAGPWLGGLLWLVVFVAVTWQAAAQPRALEAQGIFVGGAAVLAASVSAPLFYLVLPNHVAGERLSNWFVYGGLNAVCAGMGFGFAAMWLVCIKRRWRGDRRHWLLTLAQVILLMAVLFTRSRGALLALVAGHVTLLLARGWRESWADWLVLALAVAAFHASSPAVTAFAHAQTEARAEKSRLPGGEAAPPLITRDAVDEMLTRADSGRLDIYRAGLAALPNAWTWLFGIGQWGTDSLWRSHLPWQQQPEHLHSAYLATLVQGGLVGLALLAMMLGRGIARACALARGGDSTWAVLAAYGCVAMLFDGQTFTRMNSLPLFEPLLILFPLVAAASGWAHREDRNCEPVIGP